MSIDQDPAARSFVDAVAMLLGRSLHADEAALAVSLRGEKSAELVARELEAAVVADPKKIRPEHSDAAQE